MIRARPRIARFTSMARWPDSARSNVIIVALVFVLLPLLCWLAVIYVG